MRITTDTSGDMPERNSPSAAADKNKVVASDRDYDRPRPALITVKAGDSGEIQVQTEEGVCRSFAWSQGNLTENLAAKVTLQTVTHTDTQAPNTASEKPNHTLKTSGSPKMGSQDGNSTSKSGQGTPSEAKLGPASPDEVDRTSLEKQERARNVPEEDVPLQKEESRTSKKPSDTTNEQHGKHTEVEPSSTPLPYNAENQEQQQHAQPVIPEVAENVELPSSGNPGEWALPDIPPKNRPQRPVYQPATEIISPGKANLTPRELKQLKMEAEDLQMEISYKEKNAELVAEKIRALRKEKRGAEQLLNESLESMMDSDTEEIRAQRQSTANKLTDQLDSIESELQKAVRRKVQLDFEVEDLSLALAEVMATLPDTVLLCDEDMLPEHEEEKEKEEMMEEDDDEEFCESPKKVSRKGKGKGKGKGRKDRDSLERGPQSQKTRSSSVIELLSENNNQAGVCDMGYKIKRPQTGDSDDKDEKKKSQAGDNDNWNKKQNARENEHSLQPLRSSALSDNRNDHKDNKGNPEGVENDLKQPNRSVCRGKDDKNYHEKNEHALEELEEIDIASYEDISEGDLEDYEEDDDFWDEMLSPSYTDNQSFEDLGLSTFTCLDDFAQAAPSTHSSGGSGGADFVPRQIRFENEIPGPSESNQSMQSAACGSGVEYSCTEAWQYEEGTVVADQMAILESIKMNQKAPKKEDTKENDLCKLADMVDKIVVRYNKSVNELKLEKSRKRHVSDQGNDPDSGLSMSTDFSESGIAVSAQCSDTTEVWKDPCREKPVRHFEPLVQPSSGKICGSNGFPPRQRAAFYQKKPNHTVTRATVNSEQEDLGLLSPTTPFTLVSGGCSGDKGTEAFLNPSAEQSSICGPQVIPLTASASNASSEVSADSEETPRKRMRVERAPENHNKVSDKKMGPTDVANSNTDIFSVQPDQHLSAFQHNHLYAEGMPDVQEVESADLEHAEPVLSATSSDFAVPERSPLKRQLSGESSASLSPGSRPPKKKQAVDDGVHVGLPDTPTQNSFQEFWIGSAGSPVPMSACGRAEEGSVFQHAIVRKSNATPEKSVASNANSDQMSCFSMDKSCTNSVQAAASSNSTEQTAQSQQAEFKVPSSPVASSPKKIKQRYERRFATSDSKTTTAAESHLAKLTETNKRLQAEKANLAKMLQEGWDLYHQISSDVRSSYSTPNLEEDGAPIAGTLLSSEQPPRKQPKKSKPSILRCYPSILGIRGERSSKSPKRSTVNEKNESPNPASETPPASCHILPSSASKKNDDSNTADSMKLFFSALNSVPGSASPRKFVDSHGWNQQYAGHSPDTSQGIDNDFLDKVSHEVEVRTERSSVSPRPGKLSQRQDGQGYNEDVQSEADVGQKKDVTDNVVETSARLKPHSQNVTSALPRAEVTFLLCGNSINGRGNSINSPPELCKENVPANISPGQGSSTDWKGHPDSLPSNRGQGPRSPVDGQGHDERVPTATGQGLGNNGDASAAGVRVNQGNEARADWDSDTDTWDTSFETDDYDYDYDFDDKDPEPDPSAGKPAFSNPENLDAHQWTYLVMRFNENRFPTYNHLKEIAYDVGVDFRTVTLWYADKHSRLQSEEITKYVDEILNFAKNVEIPL